jgi:anti-sigma factor RsiW
MTHPHDDLVIRLLGPAGSDLSCETCFELLDRYVEAELAGTDPDAVDPAMSAHLRACPACREDHESLRAIAAEDPR